jgi:hypothetical protein
VCGHVQDHTLACGLRQYSQRSRITHGSNGSGVACRFFSASAATAYAVCMAAGLQYGGVRGGPLGVVNAGPVSVKNEDRNEGVIG